MSRYAAGTLVRKTSTRHNRPRGMRPGARSALTRVAARPREREPGALAAPPDQVGSKHTGESRNRGKGGQLAWPITTPDRRGVEMRTFAEEHGCALRLVCHPHWCPRGGGRRWAEGPVVAGPSWFHPAATGGSVARLLGRWSVPRRRWRRRGWWLGPAVGAALGSGCARWRWRRLGGLSPVS